MAHSVILTVDIGTSSVKTAVWDQQGQALAEASSTYRLHRPRPHWVEIDAEVWWQAVVSTVRQVTTRAGIHPGHIAGIGIDGMGWTCIPTDRDAKPLTPAMIWLDQRAEEESTWLNNLPTADQLVHLAANPIKPNYITPKLIWLQKHQPGIFEATYKFLDTVGFIVARFTGEFTCDYTQAYGYHFFDIRNKCWDAEAADRIGVPLQKLPRLCSTTEVVGTVSARTAQEIGLQPGIPVIAGCLDAAAGALGAGVTRLGQTNEQGGQAGGVGINLDKVVVEPRLIFSPYVLPGRYLLAAGTVGGGSLGWFLNHLGHTETAAAKILQENPFALLSLQAGQAKPGANGLIFLPYMAGERSPLWSSVARGVFFGLSYENSRADMLRAIMEGCAFAVYDNLLIAEKHGVVINEFLGSGGATKSAVWCQIKADIYGRPFVVAQRADGVEGGHGLGLFALTAHAVGLTGDIGDCINTLLPNRRTFEPSLQNHTIYQELFQVYRSVSRKLMDDFVELDRIRRIIP